MDHEPALASLRAEADYTRNRVALYQQRVYAGKGDLRRLAELERAADGAEQRLMRAQRRKPAD